MTVDQGILQTSKRVGVIVLSRMDSSRLPGKAMKMVRGRPMVSYVLERARLIQGADMVILATSDRKVDDPLCELAAESGVEIFRGASHDVAGRVLACAEHFGLDGFVRVCGDSPLIDHNMLSDGLRRFLTGGWDLVTNRHPRSFPVGMSMEIVNAAVFSEAYKRMTKDDHFEHVTLYLYENGGEYRICNIESGNEAYKDMSVAVDEPGDLLKLEWMLEQMGEGFADCVGSDLIEIASRYAAESSKRETAKV